MLRKIKINYCAELLVDIDGRMNIDDIHDLIHSNLDNVIVDSEFPNDINDVSIKNTDCWLQELPILMDDKL